MLRTPYDSHLEGFGAVLALAALLTCGCSTELLPAYGDDPPDDAGRTGGATCVDDTFEIRPECPQPCHSGSTCKLGHCVQVLATGVFMPAGIAVDSSFVYWMPNYDKGPQSEPPIMKVPTEGGPSIPVSTIDGRITDFAVHRGDVYWTEFKSSSDPYWNNVQPYDGVVRVSRAGSTTGTTIVSGFTLPMTIAVDDSGIYVGDWRRNTLSSTPLAGGPPRVIGPVGIAVNEDLAGIAGKRYGDGNLAIDGRSAYEIFVQADVISNPPHAGSLIQVNKSGQDAVTLVADLSVFVPRQCGGYGARVLSVGAHLLFAYGRCLYSLDGASREPRLIWAHTNDIIDVSSNDGGDTIYASDIVGHIYQMDPTGCKRARIGAVSIPECNGLIELHLAADASNLYVAGSRIGGSGLGKNICPGYVIKISM